MPLLAVGLNGEVYEENSFRNDGKGIGRLATFADEGSTVFGALDKRQIKNRAIHNTRMKMFAKVKRAKELKRKKFLESQEKIRDIKINRIANAERKRKLASDRRIARLHRAGRSQDTMGNEYDSMIGNIYEGFENKGQYIKNDFKFSGNDFAQVSAFGDYDEGLGKRFRVKFKPKAIVRAIARPVAKVVQKAAVVAVKVATAPTKVAFKALQTIPVVKSVYKATDKLTGGTLTSLQRVQNLPNRVARGEKISKADLMEAVMTAVKVGAIAASGGSAASLISAGAGALKGGPLGKSSLGRNLLSVTELASGGLTVKQIIEKKVEDKGKDIAIKAIEKKTKLPFSLVAAVNGAANSEGDLQQRAKDFAAKVGEDKLRKAGLGSVITQAILSQNADILGVAIAAAPDLAMSEAQRKATAMQVKIQDATNIDKIKAKLDSKLEKAKNEVLSVSSLKDRLDKEANEAVKKELEKQLAKLLSDNQKTEEEVMEASSELQVETMKSSVRVAAAEEGRLGGLASVGSYVHPILAINKRIASKL